MNTRLWLIGGAGVAALSAVYYFANRGGSEPVSAGGYPLVISGGGSATPVPASTGGSTDGSISQILNSQLALATVQQQTQLATLQTQKDIATAGFQSSLDLANVDAAKAKTTALSNIWSSLFGSAGAGSLNVAAPTSTSTSTNIWDRGGSQSQAGLFASGSSEWHDIGSQISANSNANSGFTQGSIYGTIGFDQSGNIAVNVNRQTASSYNPLPGAGSAGSAVRAA